MRRLGFLMVTIGFLGGALASVVDEDVVRWEWFVPAVGVGVVGLVLIRTHRRREVLATDRVTANIQAIEGSLRRIVENVTRLNAEKQSVDPHDVRHRIDELFADDLDAFIEARESIAHSYGLASYGEVMSCFAAAERYLNRVWSASADGYIDEVSEYLEKARDQFAESLALLCRLGGSPQGG